MWKDKIVEDLHKTRRALLAKAKGNTARLREESRALAAKLGFSLSVAKSRAQTAPSANTHAH